MDSPIVLTTCTIGYDERERGTIRLPFRLARSLGAPWTERDSFPAALGVQRATGDVVLMVPEDPVASFTLREIATGGIVWFHLAQVIRTTHYFRFFIPKAAVLQSRLRERVETTTRFSAEVQYREHYKGWVITIRISQGALPPWRRIATPMAL